MKYFTKDMWIQLQDENNNKIHDIWRKNIKLYNRQLRKLKPRLGKRSFDFFSFCHLQGDFILSINVINNGEIYFQKHIPKEAGFINNSSNPVEIMIKTLCPTKYFYLLKYKSVRKCVLDYPSDSPLWFEGKRGLGRWGYDELTYLRNGYFKHEILLHSGALITLEFKKFTYSKTKALARKLKYALCSSLPGIGLENNSAQEI